jgi:hypothetical protein
MMDQGGGKPRPYPGRMMDQGGGKPRPYPTTKHYACEASQVVPPPWQMRITFAPMGLVSVLARVIGGKLKAIPAALYE